MSVPIYAVKPGGVVATVRIIEIIDYIVVDGLIRSGRRYDKHLQPCKSMISKLFTVHILAPYLHFTDEVVVRGDVMIGNENVVQ